MRNLTKIFLKSFENVGQGRLDNQVSRRLVIHQSHGIVEEQISGHCPPTASPIVLSAVNLVDTSRIINVM